MVSSRVIELLNELKSAVNCVTVTVARQCVIYRPCHIVIILYIVVADGLWAAVLHKPRYCRGRPHSVIVTGLLGYRVSENAEV